MVDFSMTTAAQSQKITKIIVSLFFWRGNTVAVNMVNLKIADAPAVLAGMAVSLHSNLSIAVKKTVVCVALTIPFINLRVFSKPFVNSSHIKFALTFAAPMLNARPVYVIIAAIRTLLNRAFCWPAIFFAFLGNSFAVLFRPKCRLTSRANFLTSARWNINRLTASARFCSKPDASLPMCSKGARLAPFGVWGRFCEDRITIRAANLAVSFHKLISK